jgi:hypothetical protein
MYSSCVGFTRLLPVLLASAVFGFGSPASAISTTSFSFGGFLLPDDDSGIQPSVSATFTWDETCVLATCELRIDMDYLESNGGAPLTSNAQGYTGVTWDMTGGAVLLDNLVQTSAEVISPTLVGVDAAATISELTDITLNGVSGEQVTHHWGVNTGLSGLNDPSVGDNVLSSVGDVTLMGVTSLDFMGFDQLLPNGIIASTEANPPNGIPFAIVDPATTKLTPLGEDVLAQSTTTAFLSYSGTGGNLTTIDNVLPLFGTTGVAVPEPGTALLMGLGLIGLASFRRQG